MQSAVKEPKILDFLYSEAYNAYRGISFSPEKRAESIVNDYSQQLIEDLALIEDPEAKERYKHKYIQLLRAWLSAKSRCLSTMIAGASNFPVRRAEKANRAEHNASVAFTEWRERAIKAITKPPKKEVDPLEEVKHRLQARKDSQERMKKGNVIIRSKRDVENRLKEIGMSEKLIKEALTPTYYGIGFPSYMLQNNLAEIKRLEGRLKELEKKAAAKATTGNQEFKYGDITLVHNYDADRVQILFPGKPSEEVRTLLKANAFKWSPSFGAWQRQLTDNGKIIAEKLVKHLAKDQK